MPRKYDRDNKGAPSSRTPAPAVRGRAHRRPADLAPGLLLRGGRRDHPLAEGRPLYRLENIYL